MVVAEIELRQIAVQVRLADVVERAVYAALERGLLWEGVSFDDEMPDEVYRGFYDSSQ